MIGEDTLTAKEIVNEWAEESLADIIYGYGGERYARRIARAIVEARSETEIATTAQLVEIIKSAVPGGRRYHKVNPATKTFQALRIAVNDELGAARDGLSKALSVLAPNGRIAVISFHSLEDRLVKRTFKEWQKEGIGEQTTKKPIAPNDNELSVNRRARSSKLRVFRKF
jgi:16S rRNA (cytosine1402-N4)-methyltransferase